MSYLKEILVVLGDLWWALSVVGRYYIIPIALLNYCKKQGFSEWVIMGILIVWVIDFIIGFRRFIVRRYW